MKAKYVNSTRKLEVVDNMNELELPELPDCISDSMRAGLTEGLYRYNPMPIFDAINQALAAGMTDEDVHWCPAGRPYDDIPAFGPVGIRQVAYDYFFGSRWSSFTYTEAPILLCDNSADDKIEYLIGEWGWVFRLIDWWWKFYLADHPTAARGQSF